MLFQKFQQFMYGRYGGDTFSLVLLVIALVCILLAFTTNGHAGRAAD